MVSKSAVMGYFTVLVGLCFILYYLLVSPHVVAQDYTGSLSSLFNPTPSVIEHHPLAEHANILSDQFFNSFSLTNRIFSPLGLAYALAIIQEAAAGQSAEELAKVLGGKYTYGDLRKILNVFHEENENMLNIVTYWSVHHNSTITESFLKDTAGLCHISQDNYGDHMRVSHNINKIFAENTHSHINSAAKAIRPSTSSVLINTLYFQMYWKEAFDPQQTAPTNFTQFVGSQKAVPMMSKRAVFNYYKSAKSQLIEIPYNNSAYVMGIILPALDQTNRNAKTTFHLTYLMADIARMKKTQVELHIPKFKHKKMIKTHVNLGALGVKAVFDRKKAELPGLSPNIYVTEMIHEIIFIADELGSNSDRNALNHFISKGISAKTVPKPKAVPGQMGPLRVLPPNAAVMNCDHTFIYYVRHLPTNTIILLADFDAP